jgi:tetratricopeptide (TPR) repeat protein
VVKIQPDCAEAHHTPGNVYKQMKKYHESAEALRKAINSALTYAVAHYQLAVALTQKGEKDEAGREFQKASELDSHLVPPR